MSRFEGKVHPAAMNDKSNDKSGRKYESPLRQRQSERTRGLILDALSKLLKTYDIDEISMRLLAQHAGVAQQTIYRHFPDRPALITALRTRAVQQNPHPYDGPSASLEEWASRMETGFQDADEYFLAEVTANALLNADPRRLANKPQDRARIFWAAVARTFPDLNEEDRARAAALIRVLGSTQTWLRMREEFGLDGSVSGPLVKWAIMVLIREIRAGQLPPLGRQTTFATSDFGLPQNF